MQNIQKTRFIAANYSNLQGLKSVPLGLLLLLSVLWANAQTGPASDLSLPILFTLVMVLLAWAIHRYYRTRFGKIEYTSRHKTAEMILGIGGGAISLGAFIVDTRFVLPFSLVGLAFAVASVVEYLRMQWYAPGHYLLPITFVYFTIMVIVSILPLLGAGEWWRLLGLRAQLFGVLTVASVMIVGYGLFGHWFFVRQLPGMEN